jgi:L-aspartate oxidase
LVFAKRAVEHSVLNKKENIPLATDVINYSVNENRLSWFNKIKNQVAMIMMNNVGVVRIQEELNSAINKLSMLRENIPADENEYYANSAINIVNVALLITTSALIREESRGCHFRDDFTSEEEKKYTIIQNKFSGLKVTEIIDES